MLKIDVLDHGYVSLIDHMGSDAAIIDTARMSTGRGFVSWEPYVRCRRCDQIGHNDPSSMPRSVNCEHDLESFPRGDFGLLDTLWRSKHSTPFEFCELVFEVQAPIFVFREWHRHRTQSYSEFSARYSKMPKLHYLPSPDRIQRQASNNRQGSGPPIEDKDFVERYRADLAKEQRFIYAKYDLALKEGVAKEVARVNTPVSRYSKMRAKANLRNWLGFLALRLHPSAQWEIRQYANAVARYIYAKFPKTWSLFEEYDLHGASFSRTELKLLRELLGKASDSLKDRSDIPPRKLDEFLAKLNT